MADKRSDLKKIIMDTKTLPTLPSVIHKLNEQLLAKLVDEVEDKLVEVKNFSLEMMSD